MQNKLNIGDIDNMMVNKMRKISKRLLNRNKSLASNECN